MDSDEKRKPWLLAAHFPLRHWHGWHRHILLLFTIQHYSLRLNKKDSPKFACVTRKALATVKQLRGNRLGRALLSFLADYVVTPRHVLMRLCFLTSKLIGSKKCSIIMFIMNKGMWRLQVYEKTSTLEASCAGQQQRSCVFSTVGHSGTWKVFWQNNHWEFKESQNKRQGKANNPKATEEL